MIFFSPILGAPVSNGLTWHVCMWFTVVVKPVKAERSVYYVLTSTLRSGLNIFHSDKFRLPFSLWNPVASELRKVISLVELSSSLLGGVLFLYCLDAGSCLDKDSELGLNMLAQPLQPLCHSHWLGLTILFRRAQSRGELRWCSFQFLELMCL